jgi:hypothetical protein
MASYGFEHYLCALHKTISRAFDIVASSDHNSLFDRAIERMAKLDFDRLNKYMESNIVRGLGQFARAFMRKQFHCDVVTTSGAESICSKRARLVASAPSSRHNIIS